MNKRMYDKLNRWNIDDALWSYQRGRFSAAKHSLERLVRRVVDDPPEISSGKTKKRKHKKAAAEHEGEIPELGFHHPEDRDNDGHYEHL